MRWAVCARIAAGALLQHSAAIGFQQQAAWQRFIQPLEAETAAGVKRRRNLWYGANATHSRKRVATLLPASCSWESTMDKA